jgi:hypothetical protein
MDASSLYNLAEKRQPDLKDFQGLGVQRALQRAPQPLFCARFGLKLRAVRILVDFSKTSLSVLAADSMASDWGTSGLAERTCMGCSSCGSRERYHLALLGWRESWLGSQRLPKPASIGWFQTLYARQPFAQCRKRKQRRIRLFASVAARTASQGGSGKAHL